MKSNILDIYNERDKFSKLIQPYRAAIKIVQTKLEIIDTELNLKAKHNPIHSIKTRIKPFASVIDKIRREGYSYDYEGIKKIDDIAGIRVICNYLNDIQYIAQLLVLQENITKVSQANYIQYPKENGYRSFHLIVNVKVYQNEGILLVPVEIQIRTIAMDCWASLEHELVYKSVNSVNNNIRTRLQRCAELMSKTDQEMQKIHLELNQSWKENVSRETK